MRTFRFHFDFMSPFSYLAFERSLAIAARAGLPFEPVAVDLAALKLAAGNTGPSTRQMPLKSRYSAIDMARWAHRYGVALTRPEINRPERANRGFYFVEPARRVSYMRAVWRRLWGAGADVSSDAALTDIATEMGFDAAVYLAACDADTNIRALDMATRAATAQGIFGVPMTVIDDQMWWGNDRLDFIEEYLAVAGPRIRPL